MAWTTVERVKRFLALAPTDDSDDQFIADCVESANFQAWTERRQAGYLSDGIDTAPNGAVSDATTRWAALLYQARGTGEGFAGFVDTGAVIGTPYYEQRRTILLLLGVPRPTVDADPVVAP